MTGSMEPGDLNPEAIQARFAMSIQKAMEVVQPGSIEAGLSPLDVFPESTDRRSDTPFHEDFTPEQEQAFREAMKEMGVGVAHNETASSVGLCDGYIAIIEAGQPHKIIAELNVVQEDEVQPSVYFLPGTSARPIQGAEKTLAASLLGVEEDQVSEDEHALTRQIAAQVPGFRAYEEPYRMPYVYQYDRETGEVQVAKSLYGNDGQFVLLGQINGRQVISLRIDRDYYPDPNDPDKQRYAQPGPEAVIGIVSQLTSLNHDTDSQIGFATSNAYIPSRTLAGIKSARTTGRNTAVIAYGTSELARAKQVPEDEVALPALNQLAGEAYEAAKIQVA